MGRQACLGLAVTVSHCSLGDFDFIGFKHFFKFNFQCFITEVVAYTKTGATVINPRAS